MCQNGIVLGTTMRITRPMEFNFKFQAAQMPGKSKRFACASQTLI